MEFHELYRPLTAAPFRRADTYREFLPSPALRPWVRCFWESSSGCAPVLVTPDSCMDVIFNMADGSAGFCGIDDRTVWAYPTEGERSFAIRFYPWAAAILADGSLRDTRNARCDAGQFFGGLEQYLRTRWQEGQCLETWAKLAEEWLLERLDGAQINGDVLEASWRLVRSRGVIRVEALSRSLHVSSRQLERLFRENMGVSPKKLAGIIRYQNLWRDILLEPRFDVQEAVGKYGYTDQAHLLHDFRKYHLLSLAEARCYAFSSRFYNTEP